MLDAVTGSWLGEDPVWSEGRYGYVGGRVVVSVDVTGAYAQYVSIAYAACVFAGLVKAKGRARVAEVKVAGGVLIEGTPEYSIELRK